MAKIMASLQAFPSSLLPRARSRALIPFPFPFERLPRRLSWRGFWLSLACWAIKTTDIIFNTLTELREILLSDGSSWKKVQRKQQSSVSAKPKLVGLEDSRSTGVWWNKHCKPLDDSNLTELCGIYEWRAIRRQDQPNRVVYVGSTCTRFDNNYYELLRSRILGWLAR